MEFVQMAERNNQHEILNFLQAFSLIKQEQTCPKDHQMKIKARSLKKINHWRYYWRCPKKKCQTYKSIKSGSFFEEGTTPIAQVLLIIADWVQNTNQKLVCGISSTTISLYNKRIRYIITNEVGSIRIGSPDLRVEVLLLSDAFMRQLEYMRHVEYAAISPEASERPEQQMNTKGEYWVLIERNSDYCKNVLFFSHSSEAEQGSEGSEAEQGSEAEHVEQAKRLEPGIKKKLKKYIVPKSKLYNIVLTPGEDNSEYIYKIVSHFSNLKRRFHDPFLKTYLDEYSWRVHHSHGHQDTMWSLCKAVLRAIAIYFDYNSLSDLDEQIHAIHYRV